MSGQLVTLEFKPGVIKDDTPLSAEGGWIDSNFVRFRRGRAEVIGGWDLTGSQSFTGIARGAHAWVDLDGTKYAAWGTAANLYVLAGGAVIDATPVLTEGVYGTNPFTTTSGSAVVTVAHPAHGLLTGDTVTFTNAATFNGLTLAGPYAVTVTSEDAYTITAASNATGSGAGGGSLVGFSVPFPAGNVDAVPTGYGSGLYGAGPYGVSGVSDTEPRTWSLDNWGRNLLANPSGRGIYEFQPAPSYPELAAGTWTLGTGWSGTTMLTATAGTASSALQTATMTGGRVYRATFTVTRTAGTVKFQAFAGTSPVYLDVGGFPATTSASQTIGVPGTYSFLFYAPDNPVGFAFTKDNAFAGTISAVSVKVESKAYRIQNAPARVYAMFVDPNKLVVAMGCQNAIGVFDPLLIRWSGQGNNRDWVPSASNLAGEYPISHGGRIMNGLATRGQNLIWTDGGLFSMQFVGSSGAVYSIRLLATGCGLLGPQAATEHSGIVMWWSDAGPWIFRGGLPEKVDCPLQFDVLDNLAPFQNAKFFAAVNSAFDEMWFGYADARDGKECSRFAVFNYIENHWVTHKLARSAWIDAEILDYPQAFGVNGRIYEHERGQSAAGMPLIGWLESSYFDIEDGNNLMIIRRIVPDFEDQVGGVNFSIQGKPFPNGSEWSWGPYMATPTKQKLDMRKTARQLKLRLDFAEAPASWRLGKLRVDADKSGATR